MNGNIRRVFLITTLLVLLVGISALSAVDVSDNTTATQSIAQDTPSTSTQVASTVSDTASKAVEDTQIATTSKAKSVAKENTQTSTKAAKTLKSSNTSYVDNDTFDDYFASNGFKSTVSSDDTINFDNDIARYNNTTYIVNKPVHINGNGHTLTLNTTSGSYYGNETGASFIIDNGAKGSTLTNIRFYNTQVIIRNTSDVTINNCSFIVDNQRIGQGIGATSIRAGSSYITVENSIFETTNNSGSSSLVLASASYCTINNNTITGTGNVGNLLYLTTYNIEGVNETDIELNSYNNITNNRITGPSKRSPICYGIALTGHDNIIENNTINVLGQGITTQWAYVDPATPEIGNNSNRYKGNYYINNIVLNEAIFKATNNSTLENNKANGTVYSGLNSTLKGNNFPKEITLPLGSNALDNNVFGTVTLKGNNDLNDSVIKGNVIVDGSNILINGNDIYGYIIVNSENYTNITITNNVMDDDIQSNGNTYITQSNNTLRDELNAKKLKTKSVKSDLTQLTITPANYEDYFRNIGNVLYSKEYMPRNHNVTIIGLPYPVGQLGVARNTILRLEDVDTSLLHSHDLLRNVTIVNTTYTLTENSCPRRISGNNDTYDGVILNANFTSLPSEPLDLLRVEGNGFTMKNSLMNVSMITNTINWDNETSPRIVPIRINGNNALFENNTIIINITGYEENGGFDYPTCFGFYISGSNTTIRNNNITIICPDNTPGWLYSFEVLSSNNVFDNNNIIVRGVNYTAGIYFDSSTCQNNTVSNNYINLTTGNAGYGEGTINENVGYAITFTNRAYQGGQYKAGVGSFKNNTAVNNTIIGNGYAMYGIEQFGGDNTTVANNTIILNGTAVSGIAMIGINTTVTGNNVTVNGKDNATYTSVDYLIEQTTGISLQRGSDNLVTNNTINSNNNAGIIIISDKNTTVTNNNVQSLNNTYAVTLINDASNVNITNNTLRSNGLKGDNSVLNDGTDNTVKDNGPNTIDTVLTVEPITTVSSGSHITVIGKLVDENGNVLPSRQIHMVVENVTQMQITNNNGTFTKTIKVNNVGTYNITLTYEGNSEYEASNVTTTYTVTKANTTVTIDPIDGVLGKEVSFTAHVVDENNQPVTGGYVIFKVNGVTLKDINNTPIQVNVTNGVATFNTTATWSKAVNTTVAYSGSDNYNKARIDNGSITIAKQNATVSVLINENIKPGENLTAVVNVTDADGNIINAGTVIFKINGKTLKDENNQTIVYNVTNGTVTLNYIIPDNYSAKTYTLTAVYGGSIYNRVQTTENFTLTKLDSSVALNLTTDDLKPGSQIIAVATITDANGNPVTRGHVTFKLNDKTITDNDTRYVVDVTNGVATLNYTIPSNYSAKTYKLSAVFGGSNYNTNEAAQNITLNKIDTNIITQNITITDNTLNVQATINNIETGSVANERTQKVSVKYDKHTVINSTIIEDGVIDLTTTLTDVHAGEHIVEIVTSGNSIYNPNRVNTTVTTQ